MSIYTQPIILLRITQEFLESKIRLVFLQFVRGYCRKEIFLSAVKYSTAVLVMKALGVSTILMVTWGTQTNCYGAA